MQHLPDFCALTHMKFLSIFQISEAVKKEVSNANHMFRNLVEKGLAKINIKDDAEELLQKHHDPNKDNKPYLITLKEHPWVRTFATVSKDSDMNLQWWSMRNNLFKPLLLVQ